MGVERGGFLLNCLEVNIHYFIVLSGSVPCEDHHPKCGHWAARGECKKNVKWMSKHCKVSCGKCAQGMQPGSTVR